MVLPKGVFRWCSLYSLWKFAIAVCLAGTAVGIYFLFTYEPWVSDQEATWSEVIDGRKWPELLREKDGTAVPLFLLDLAGALPCPQITYMSVTVSRNVESTLQETLELDKGTGCDFPHLDPFAWDAAQFDEKFKPIQCKGQDWIGCYHSTCGLVDSIKETNLTDVVCSYRDILYHHDYHYTLGRATRVRGGVYKLKASDHVKVTCTGKLRGKSVRWSGIKIGFRPVKPPPSPPGREENYNVLVFGFDSNSRTGFNRLMPKSWAALKELGTTVMQGYNIVGDGTVRALSTILTGRAFLELPEVRKGIRNNYTVDTWPLLFYNLQEDGYRTAFFEDSACTGTFQYRYTGFRRQPAAHYLRAFGLVHLARTKRLWTRPNCEFCVGDTMHFKLMMNITQQFMELDGKRFIFTFISDISHYDINYIQWADDDTAAFLRSLNKHTEDSLIIIMGDHGPRYSDRRRTLRGKLDERLPLMAIRLPSRLTLTRPAAQSALEANAHVLTTPHDVHTTILDVLDLRKHWYTYRVPGADLPRGLTWLEQIPRSRSCSEAGIEAHWCSCLTWQNVSTTDPIYSKAGEALVHSINELLYKVSTQCAPRTLTSIKGVAKQHVNSQVDEEQMQKDSDSVNRTSISKERYQVTIEAGPGRAMFEATMTYIVNGGVFTVNSRDISRISAYEQEPECIIRSHPDLAPFCYCR